MNLVIVESPTKIKTLEKYLGKDYSFAASYGHLRDLPKKKLGVDVDNKFTPEYEIPDKSKKAVASLKKSAKEANEIFLAMDPDREGEAIAYHILHILGNEVDKRTPLEPASASGETASNGARKYHRVSFNAITKDEVTEAFKKPRKIDTNLFDAQQARRILDRLVGYKLSPLIWKKIRYGLSAGRVQSVAVRFVVERDQERNNFKAIEYYQIIADLKDKKETFSFLSQLNAIDEEKIEVRERFKLFAGPYTAKRTSIGSKGTAENIIEDLKGSEYRVEKVEQKKVKKSPPPPFTTSTLQQAASSLFGFPPKRTMRVAQKLYENGLITYMRTDSMSINPGVIEQIRNRVKEKYGDKYLSEKERVFRSKSKVAQEAHEAIRPAQLDESSKLKTQISKLKGDEKRLFELIYKRTVATQMKEAIFNATKVELEAVGTSGKKYLFVSSGLVKDFDGYLKLTKGRVKEDVLPELKVGDKLVAKELSSEKKNMSPPPRYTEASLVKELEKNGIGRPSTYAPIISTITSRGYVSKKEGRLHSEDVGIVVNNLLVGHFPEIVSIKFTSKLEGDLDSIAAGDKKWVPIIDDFYKPFEKDLEKANTNLKKDDFVVLEKTEEVCPECSKKLVVKLGKFGKFLSCSNFPECKYAKPLDIKTHKDGEEVDEKQLGKCPECKSDLQLRTGRFGKFVACTSYPKCKYTKQYKEKIGMSCPDCEKGDIIARRTKKGRLFYGCSKYPKCDFASWTKPRVKKSSS